MSKFSGFSGIIIDYIVDIINESHTSAYEKLYIIDSLMSTPSTEDILTDYVKHYMLSDEDIDIDAL